MLLSRVTHIWVTRDEECMWAVKLKSDSCGDHMTITVCVCSSVRCAGCEAVLCGIEEQVSRANQYRESQLKVKVQVETEVSVWVCVYFEIWGHSMSEVVKTEGLLDSRTTVKRKSTVLYFVILLLWSEQTRTWSVLHSHKRSNRHHQFGIWWCIVFNVFREACESSVVCF